MEHFYEKYNKNIVVFAVGCVMGFLCVLPFLSNLIYSIDDYHLWNVYDLNWETMGYNFYSTGRAVEGILCEILYQFNLQPLNRPTGMLVFIVSLSMLGTFIGDLLNLKSTAVRILICVLAVLNPFSTEIYYYSNITVYSGFAIVFLVLGLSFTQQYIVGKKRIKLVFSCAFYCLSLGVYQIFYPIVLFIILFMIIRDYNEGIMEWKKYSIYGVVYFFSFLLFYIVLKVMFALMPPTLIYEGIDLGEFVRSLFTSDYYIQLLNTVRNYYGDTMVHSALAFRTVIIGSAIVFVFGVLNMQKNKRWIYFIGVSLYLLLGPVMCLGFGLARMDNISSRTFTSYGVYLSGLLLIDYYYIQDISKKKESIRKQSDRVMIAIFAVICFVNGSLIGRAANNIMRLNEEEANMVNRIVYRMEEYEEFTGFEPLVILGTPMLSNMANKSLGNLGEPASVSFSKVLLFNEISGYSFAIPSAEQVEKATQMQEDMKTWPKKDSVAYIDGMFIVRLYW